MNLLALNLENNKSLEKLLAISNEAIVSDNTRITYEQQWKLFEKWCTVNNYDCLPASYDAIIFYLNHRALNKCSSSTLQICLYAINWVHKINGLIPPRDNKQFLELTNNLLKVHKMEQIKSDLIEGINRQAVSATNQIMQDMFYAIKYSDISDNIKLRDSAMLATAYSTAARRSELSRLLLNDLEQDNDEYRINIRYSKTDHSGIGRMIGVINGNIIPAAKYLREWLDVHPLKRGYDPVFPRLHNSGECITDKPLSGEGIARRFGYWGRQAGCDGLTGHSTRRGAATDAARAGKNMFDLMKLGGWRTPSMPARYVEESDALLNHPLRGVI